LLHCGAIKAGSLFCASYIFLHDLPPSPYFLPYG
jgi:hypothetical protein